MSTLGPERYLALCAQQALVAGRPLADELLGAVASAGLPSTPEHLAIVRARQGQLRGALEALGFDPIGAAATELVPEAAVEVSRRLEALPDARELELQLKNVVGYLLLVAMVVVLCGLVVSTFALPSLELASAQHPGAGTLREASLFLALGVGAAAILALLVGARVELQAPRVLTAAATLVSRGRRPEEVLPALLGAAPLARKQLGARLDGGGLDAATLEALASQLAGAAVRRTTALLFGLRTVGTLLLLAAALGISSSVYQAISAIPSHAGLP